jgi:hypothetical protein
LVNLRLNFGQFSCVLLTIDPVRVVPEKDF